MVTVCAIGYSFRRMFLSESDGDLEKKSFGTRFDCVTDFRKCSGVGKI